VAATGKPSHAITEVDDIVAQLRKEVRSGDVIAVMSNGGFGGIHEKLLGMLK